MHVLLYLCLQRRPSVQPDPLTGLELSRQQDDILDTAEDRPVVLSFASRRHGNPEASDAVKHSSKRDLSLASSVAQKADFSTFLTLFLWARRSLKARPELMCFSC